MNHATREPAITSDHEPELAILYAQVAALREELRNAREEVRAARAEARRAWETLRHLAALTESGHLVEEILRDVDLN